MQQTNSVKENKPPALRTDQDPGATGRCGQHSGRFHLYARRRRISGAVVCIRSGGTAIYRRTRRRVLPCTSMTLAVTHNMYSTAL